MDEVEKRILGYVLTTIIAAVLAYLDVLGFRFEWDAEFIVLLNGILGAVVGGLVAWIRYKFKIKVVVPGVPEVPTEPEPAPEPTTPT